MIAVTKDILNEHGTSCPYKICTDLKIKIQDMELPDSIRGLYVMSNEKQYILINSKIESHIDRCVILAHELGHAVLHNECVIQASTRVKTNNMHEYQANLFAAHLLTGGKDVPCHLKKEFRRCANNAERAHNLLVRLSFARFM